MGEGFWLVLVFIIVVIAWVLSKVRYYMRKSDAQWEQVDKSKLKTWEDDEDES